MKEFINKNKVKLLIVFTLLVIFGITINHFYLSNDAKKGTISPKVKEIIEKNKESNNEDDNNQLEEPEEEKEVYINQLPNYRNQYNNQSIYGRLIIPQLKMDSLITISDNNSYYIDHDIYNNYNKLGNPFFDHRNVSLSTDRQINIYGHNTQNEKYYDALPFTNLEAYTDENVFKTVKDIYLEIDERKLIFQVIAIKIITNNDNEHMKLVFYSDEDFLNHSKKLLDNTLFKENTEITASDRLLVLQACHYNPMGSYLLVIAKEKV